MAAMPDIPPPTLTIKPEPHESADELRDRHIGVLLAHARHIAQQVAELVVMHRDTRRELDAHVKAETAWQQSVSAELKANTEATVAVKEWSERRRWWSGFKERLIGLRGWIVGISTTIAAVIGAWVAIAQLWSRGGPPGGGIGPAP